MIVNETTRWNPGIYLIASGPEQLSWPIDIIYKIIIRAIGKVWTRNPQFRDITRSRRGTSVRFVNRALIIVQLLRQSIFTLLLLLIPLLLFNDKSPDYLKTVSHIPILYDIWFFGENKGQQRVRICVKWHTVLSTLMSHECRGVSSRRQLDCLLNGLSTPTTTTTTTTNKQKPHAPNY